MKNNTGNIIKQRIILSIIVVVLILSMSVGYALYNEELSLLGRVSFEYDDSLVIGEVSVSESVNAYNEEVVYNEFIENTLESTQTFRFTSSKESDSLANYIVYHFKITNLSEDSYVFTGIDSLIEVDGDYVINTPILSGISDGEVISSGESVAFELTYYHDERLDEDISINASVSFNFDTNLDYESTANVAASLDVQEASFQDGIAKVRVDLISTYDYALYYTFSLSDDNYMLVDYEGNALNQKYILLSGVTTSEEIYIKASNDTEMKKDISVEISITLDNNVSYSCGSLYLINDMRLRYENVTVTYVMDSDNVNFHITNNNDEDISSWLIYIYLSDDLLIEEFTGDESIYYDEENHIIKISSGDLVLKKKETIVLNPIKIKMNMDELKIERIIVYQDEE